MKDHIAELINAALDTLIDNGSLPADIQRRVNIDRTKDKSHGDLASNIALTLAKPAGKPPRDVAQLIIDALPASDSLSKTEIAGPGFINFFLNEAAATQIVKDILEQGKTFGTNKDGAGKKVQVEFTKFSD